MVSEREQPVLQFLCCKGIAYRQRMMWIIAAAALGLLLQVLFLCFWYGASLLVVSVALSWVVGYDNRADPRHMRVDAQWHHAGLDRLEAITRLDRDIRRWDASFWDISNPRGIFLFFVVMIGLFVLTIWSLISGGAVFTIIVGDGLLLMVLQWFNGMRRSERQPDLTLKAEHLLDVLTEYRARSVVDGEIGVQLLLDHESESPTPFDVKLVITFPEGPDYLYGLQCQVVINRVQGKPHAYCYCVVLAEAGHQIAEVTRKVELPSKTIREESTKKDVEIIVVRQKTTKKSGYHTSVAKSSEILKAALEMFAAICEKGHAKAVD